MRIGKYLFKGHLDDGEEIHEIIHKHFFVLFKDSLKTIFFGLLLPIGLYLFFPQMVLIALAWGIGGIVALIERVADWYFDAWLITNFGIVDVDRNGVFDKSSTKIEYHMIEGTSYSVTGVWATMFNFGEITIDKLGSKTSVVLEDAASPRKVERMVMRYQEQYVNERSFKDHEALKDMLADMIAYHIQNNKVKIKRPRE